MDVQMAMAVVSSTVMVAAATLSVSNTVVNALASPAIEGTATAPAEVVAGDAIPVEWSVIKRVNCPGMTARVWSGRDGFQLAEPMQPTSLPATQAPALYRIQTQVPTLAPPGDLSLNITGFYECDDGPKEWFTLNGPIMRVVGGERDR